jgi:hypothetical protein
MRNLAWLALALASVAANAGEGVLEINQACATQTGCFPGDGAGFPVVISSSGSYRLTSNLSVPDANTSGVVVLAASVDLNLASRLAESRPAQGSRPRAARPPVQESGSTQPRMCVSTMAPSLTWARMA